MVSISPTTGESLGEPVEGRDLFIGFEELLEVDVPVCEETFVCSDFEVFLIVRRRWIYCGTGSWISLSGDTCFDD
ncbi:12674_t:CDS:2 [Rhizophagus irregularis]|nr:12674_t:CDS:2 [Rhizophagus irregularis]